MAARCGPAASRRVYRARRFVARHRLGLAFGAVALAGLVGYTVITARHADDMTLAADRERLEAAKARETADFVVGMFAASDPDTAQGREISASEILARGLERAELLSGQPVLQARLLSTIGAVHLSLGRYAQARIIAERALEASRGALGEAHPDVGRDYRLLGRALGAVGEPGEAVAMFRRALAIHQQADGPAGVEAATDLHELGYALAQSDAAAEGEPLIEESLALRRAHLGNTHEDVATSLSGLAYVRGQLGRPREAVPLYREALAVRVARLGERHPEVARARQNLGYALTTAGDYAEAAKEFERTLAVYRLAYGESHPSIATTLNNLGRLEITRGDHGRAAERLREALAMRVALLGSAHPSTQIARSNLAVVLLKLDRLTEAETLMREVLAGTSPTSPRRATPLANLADVLRQRGKLAEAEAAAREALVLDRGPGGNPLGEAASLSVLGRVLAAQQRYGEARESLQRAVDIRSERLGEAHPTVVRTRGYLEAISADGDARHVSSGSRPRQP